MSDLHFKAWDKTNKKWIDDFLMSENGVVYGVPDMVEDKVLSIDWQNIEVIQYTGLKDSNHKKIYEGDICEYQNNFFNAILKVRVYKEDGCFWYKHVSKDVDKHFSRILVFSMHDELEVIGHTLQNPELLER